MNDDEASINAEPREDGHPKPHKIKLAKDLESLGKNDLINEIFIFYESGIVCCKDSKMIQN